MPTFDLTLSQAGLFSAVLTAFIVDVYQDMKIDYSQDASDVLRQILRQLQGNVTEPASLVTLAPQPSSPVTAVLVLWFTSLALSLLSALFSIFMKQWLHAYEKWMAIARTSCEDGLILRSFYQDSLAEWHVTDIFAALGVLLQLALILFVIGLVTYLWTLDFIVSPILTFFALVMITFSILVTILPAFNVRCPYKFPLAYALVKLRTSVPVRDWTERDLPFARARLYKTESLPGLEQVIGRTALLLDIQPGVLKDVLAAASMVRDTESVQGLTAGLTPPSAMDKNRTLVQDRVQNLSQESTALLSKFMTSANLLRQDLDDATEPYLLALWVVIYEATPNPPTSMILVLRHLVSQGKRQPQLAQRYMSTLVFFIQKCSDLKSGEFSFITGPLSWIDRTTADISASALAMELTEAALLVEGWAKLAKDDDGDLRAALATQAMCCAAARIPLDTDPITGLSPMTPYLPFLEALLAYDSKSDPPPYGLTPEPNPATLHARLINYHASFFCTRRRHHKSPNTDEPRTVGFTSQDCRLVVGTDEAVFWDFTSLLSDGEAKSHPVSMNDLTLNCARASGDGHFVCFGSREGSVAVAEVTDTGPVFKRQIQGQGKMSRVGAFAVNNRHVVVLGEMNAASLCDALTGETVMTFEGHGKKVIRAAFSPTTLTADTVATEDPSNASGNEHGEEHGATHGLPNLATSSCDNTLRIWDVETGRCIKSIELATAAYGICWSTDGRSIAVATGSQCSIYDVATHESQPLQGHTKLVTEVTFSPNGTLIATASNDRTIRVWHVAKKVCIAILGGPTDEINDVEFSPNGLFIAAAADDGTWIWDINQCTEYNPVSVASVAGKPRKPTKREMSMVPEHCVTCEPTCCEHRGMMGPVCEEPVDMCEPGSSCSPKKPKP